MACRPVAVAAARGVRALAPRVRAAVAAAVVVTVLAGCAPDGAPRPSRTSTAEAACAAAVDDIVTAVRTMVSRYGGALTADAAPASPAPAEAAPAPTGASPPPSHDAAAEDRALQDAVASSRATRQRDGCATFDKDLASELAAVAADGAVADAVLRRVSATLLGTLERDPAPKTLAAGEDLRDAIARAAIGAVIELPAGTLTLSTTIVLLDPITLRGAGRTATTLRSTAPDAAILVAGTAAVRVSDLSLTLSGTRPASGVVAGPGTSLALTRTTVSGAPAGVAGDGGAGVYLSGSDPDGGRRDTSLETTDATFTENGWAGVAVSGDHRISMQSTRFDHNGTVGLLLLDAAGGSVSGSTFADNDIGIAVSGTASPTLKSNTVTGGSVAVQTDGSATPIIDGLQVSGVHKAAVVAGGTSGGWFGGVACPSAPYGIVVSATAAPTLDSNLCPLQRGAS